MMIHEITEKVGKYKARKRVGRGRSSGCGKTSGRGHKGAGSRAGFKRRAYFEGGQMPFARRIPKRGFSNAAFKRLYHVVNIKTLETLFEDGENIDIQALIRVGVVRDLKLPLKILGEGDLTKKFEVTAAKFSATAKAKIEAAGGKVTEVRKVKWTRTPGPRKAAAKGDSAS